MKKNILCAVLLSLLGAGSTFAAVEDHDYALSVTTTNADSDTYVIRGIVQGIYVDGPAAGVNATGVVLITTAQGQTLLSKTQSSDAYYPVRAQINNTSGAAAGDALVAFTNAIYAPIGVAGRVTARVAGTSADTNSVDWAIKIIYEK